MKLMKSLVNYLSNNNISILLRNSLNIRPVNNRLLKVKSSTTVSDAFLWRTDNGFRTKFKYSDILHLFYKIKNSFIEIHIYSNKNKLLKIERFTDLNLSNEFEITSQSLGGLKDYGVFYIYHFTDKKLSHDDIISNRCYLGYSKNNNLYSFVHGNTLAKFTNINKNNKYSSNIVKTSLFKNQNYTIQKLFDNFDNNELFFSNPTSKILRFTIENVHHKLNPGCTKIINTKNSIITITSNCLFFRPTIFSYKKGYFDVHHS